MRIGSADGSFIESDGTAMVSIIGTDTGVDGGRINLTDGTTMVGVVGSDTGVDGGRINLRGK
jgi:hypothetical protein